MPFILPKPSSFISINMRAIVLLCMLHAGCGQRITNPWNGPDHKTPTPPTADHDQSEVCLLDSASCGCCVMQKQVENMEWYFNEHFEELNKMLKETKMILNNMRASRSAFSVALKKSGNMGCYGKFSNDRLIVYKHVFINLGGSYNVQTGIFTVPRSGVYSLSVTINANSTTCGTCADCACGNLEVNGQVVSKLFELNGQDDEDSVTIVKAMNLKAGNKVAVNLSKGCVIYDDSNHYNTFTGFLLYAID